MLTGVAGRTGFTVITVFKDNMHNEVGFGYRLLRVLDRYNISFEHVPSGIDTMSLVVADAKLREHLEAVLREIRRDCNPRPSKLQSNMALIATVGKGMVRNIGTAAKLFNALYEAGVNVRNDRPGLVRDEHHRRRGRAAISRPPCAPSTTPFA